MSLVNDKRRVAILHCAAQLSPVYTFYLHKHVILLRIEAPNQLNPLGPATLSKIDREHSMLFVRDE